MAKQSLSHQSDLATATLNLRQPISVRPWSGFEDGVEGGVSVMDANRTRTTNLFANTKPICITSAQSMTVKALMLVPVTRGQRWWSGVRINNLEGDLVLEVDRSDDSNGDTSLSLSLYAWIGGLLTPLHGGTWRNDVSSVGKREAVVMVAGGSASLWLFNCLGLFGHKKRKEICRLFGDCWVGDDVVFLFSWHSFIGPTHHIVEIAYSTIAADMLPR